MDHFHFRDGRLHAEDVPVEAIAAAVGTPCYIYASATIERHYRVLAEAFGTPAPLVCYAVKANGNLGVVATLAALGAGADVVSAGELAIARSAGVPPGRIVFSGVGKRDDELAAALQAGILQINVESEPELEALSAVANALGARARVAIRINPDVDARTHAKISTGRAESKFGIDWTVAHRVYAKARRLPGVEPVGIAVHIGSQLTEIAPFEQAFRRLRDLVAILRADGHVVTTLDLGGGLGVPYGDEEGPIPGPEAYARACAGAVGDLGCRVIVEPGRLLVANAGVLVTRVVYRKEGATRTFVVVDAGMNDLLRPALYDARHRIVPVRAPHGEQSLEPVDVVGPICETSDVFARDCPLPAVGRGDLLAVRSAGAYGSSMASFYNGRALCAEVLVKGGAYAVVGQRIPHDVVIACQHLPPWLAAEPGGEAATQIRTCRP